MTKSPYFIGVMSGTSLDAVDAVLVGLEKEQPTLISYHSHPIPPTLKQTVLDIIEPSWIGSLQNVGNLNQQLGYLFADSVLQLLEKSTITAEQITAIGSHGQTVWHQPLGDFPFSMQLGDANIIAEQTRITTIADFRSRDIAAGGQGAPLVPAFHHHALSHPSKNRIILNIGGIANISYLPSSKNDKDINGYDTGPGNGLMDAWISEHKHSSYDKNGAWATSGNVIQDALAMLLDDEFFSLTAPKSTGKEAFNLKWLENKLGKQLYSAPTEDIQATLLELTAISISEQINKDCDEIFVCGGGIHNAALMKRLQQLLPNIPVKSTQALGIDPDWMEAIAFAWLAKQTVDKKAGNLPVTTGAKGFRVLGAVYSR